MENLMQYFIPLDLFVYHIAEVLKASFSSLMIPYCRTVSQLWCGPHSGVISKLWREYWQQGPSLTFSIM